MLVLFCVYVHVFLCSLTFYDNDEDDDFGREKPNAAYYRVDDVKNRELEEVRKCL